MHCSHVKMYVVHAIRNLQSYRMFKYNKLLLRNQYHVSIMLSPYVLHMISAGVRVQHRYKDTKQHLL